MAGEIHGIIDREQAWAMWKPYGERTKDEYDHQIHPETMSPVEAAHVLSGMADEAIFALDKSENLLESEWEYIDEGFKAVPDMSLKPTQQLISWLSARQSEQVRAVQSSSNEWERNRSEFLKSFGRSAVMLAKDGTLTDEQVERGRYWLQDESGNPRIEYTPTTRLAEARRLKHYNYVMPLPVISATTSLSEGIITHPVIVGNPILTNMNRVHEHVHAAFSGVEMLDITLENNKRYPAPQVFGLYGYVLSPKIEAKYTYEDSTDGELNEAVTEYLSQRLMDLEPGLGEYSKCTDYQEWVDRIAKLRVQDTPLFRKIIDTYFVETTTTQLTAKRDALAEMHEYADKRMGKKDALTTYMTEATGTLHDVKSK